MNKKNIAKSCNYKLKDWLDSIEDLNVVQAITKNAMITGGAIVSLLNNEKPNDYDIYFKSLSACVIVAEYYANIWNETHTYPKVKLEVLEDRLSLTIGNGRGDGVTPEGIDDPSEPQVSDGAPAETNLDKPKYRPRYFTTNAISLSDDIQLIIRFTGPIDEIHENYDFEHCKCSFDFDTGEVNLPPKALECIINKELYYSGSKYPLCSMIRTRKFISRGWTINAGQYVKMALQLNELNLKDITVFKDQLVGVDSAYFNEAILNIEKRMAEHPDFILDNAYLFEIINRIF